MSTNVLMKKGQIQMFETMAVMMVFFFILAFGLSFYFFIAKAGAEREIQRFRQVEAIKSAQRLSGLPELDCSEESVRELRCVDLWKIEEFTKLLQDRNVKDYYWDTFGYVNLTIRKIYPETGSYNLYDFPREKFRGMSFIQIPMLVYHPVEENNTFGVLEVVYYD